MLQHPNICALRASSSLSVRPVFSIFLSWSWVISSFVFKTSALSSFDLSIKAAILFGSNKSFFSNSDTCLTSLSIFSGFCFFSSLVSTFFKVLSGSGIASGVSFSIFLLFCSGARTVFVFDFLLFLVELVLKQVFFLSL